MKLLIFTDLDGSLLDHHNYSFSPAESLLKQLAGAGVPVIPNTSKTRAELAVIRKNLPGNDPFIVENGGAAYLPASSSLAISVNLIKKEGLYCKAFTRPRVFWLEKLAKLAPELQKMFQGFSEMSVEDLIRHTGLSTEEARLAREREYNEPILWLGSEKEKETVIQLLVADGGVVLEGGRFLHLGGETDKAKAMHWLRAAYQEEEPDEQFTTIALGDSGNDRDMLEQADLAVVIKSPVHPYPELKRSEGVYYTEKVGPEGWVEGIMHHLNSLNIQLEEN